VSSNPNINAIGLLKDVLVSIEDNIIGNAKEAGFVVAMTCILDDAKKFVETVNLKLDEEFGRKE
jgi:ABC-type proline/glycine betaine transport system permease subunit